MVRELQDEPEKGLRCSACFQLRLDLVAEKAVALGYDYFGSASLCHPKKTAN
jgi:predicted adenine nucleotide alpha hydrolase (AANH) superfamily ATPase